MPIYLALGMIAGFLGVAYNHTLLGTLAAAERLRRWPTELRAVRASGVHGARGQLGNLDRYEQECTATASEVTYTDASNFPRFLVEFSNENLKPRLAANLFTFKKPPNATQIEFRALCTCVYGAWIPADPGMTSSLSCPRRRASSLLALYHTGK